MSFIDDNYGDAFRDYCDELEKRENKYWNYLCEILRTY